MENTNNAAQADQQLVDAGKVIFTTTDQVVDAMVAGELDAATGKAIIAELKADAERAAQAKASRVNALSHDEFLRKARALKLTSEDGAVTLVLMPTLTGSGAYGWGFNGKLQLVVDGNPIVVQAGCNLTAVKTQDPEVAARVLAERAARRGE